MACIIYIRKILPCRCIFDWKLKKYRIVDKELENAYCPNAGIKYIWKKLFIVSIIWQRRKWIKIWK